MSAPGKKSVRFSDEPETFYFQVKKASPVAEKRQKLKHQIDAELNKFVNQLTPQKLADNVKQYVTEELDTINAVPNNSLFPVSYCDDCVDRIASYFQDENIAKNITNKYEADKEVYIIDVKKLATWFLGVQRFYFYDHVTVQAFNKNAMERGGPKHAKPLSMACLEDIYDRLYEELAGKETVCAAFSTGLAMLCKNDNTHKQVLEENVDHNLIRDGCSCFKSSEWLMQRATDRKKVAKKYSLKLEDETNEIQKEIKIFSEKSEYYDHPRNFIVGQKTDKEYWLNTKTASSCLALCRHDPCCFVNAINKKRILESLTLVRLSGYAEEGGIASSTGEYFTVIDGSPLIFSLGATVYEALVSQCEDDKKNAVPKEATIAKVYTTVNTVAVPFFRNVPVCHIEHKNKYGYYKAFRVWLPGNFSGCYNDTSIDWRSELYSRLTYSAAETESRGNKKSHYFFMEQDGRPRIKLSRVEGRIVYDNSGDMSGNYLYHRIGCVPEKKLAVVAYANVRNLTYIIKSLKSYIESLLMGPFKQHLVDLKCLDIEKKRGFVTVHEKQRMYDVRKDLQQKVKFAALNIENYERCLKSLELTLDMMNKYLSYNLDGYAGAFHKTCIDDDDNIIM